ncbi:hypothetical protein IQ07DRAFT_388850 [Pyrenochaeta sp. DS3sAY3a]|nr:hypothetical protein IQ07DRAFT_388850 [Pyrenochaeta sp. DS3sAY3a]
MSSYGSNKSGFLHPQYQQAPPYPTTPGPTQPQQSPFYPSAPPQQYQHHQQQHQHQYGTSPTTQAMYSSSPTSPSALMPDSPPDTRQRRSSSFTKHSRPGMPLPIPIRQSQPSTYAYAHTPPSSYPPQPTYAQPGGIPVYARSSSYQPQGSSAYNPPMHDGHTYGDGEDRFDGYDRIDEERERERAFEKRYAREKRAQRELENRPTLGGSVMSMVGKVGRAFGSEKR